ncbi:MAG: ATP-binding protein [Bacteroidales bacterium]|nr:ATP-binding protein [Bacteroidales bacterium]
MKEKKITLNNNIEQLSLLAQFIDSIAIEWKLNSQLQFNLNLILEELISNTIFYGYKDTEEHRINIEFINNDSFLRIKIEDDAQEFNPLIAQSPDLNLPVEQREIGGLGIHLVRSLSDSIDYHRINNKNIIFLSLNLS